ncbi:unnamed protein product [Rotaria sordida]|nr:unnamed protein product [Rotaria sordida]CAF3948466.1 unnamed protein product [Rotaria sordida]
MNNRKLDYIYRSSYSEPTTPMQPILRRFLKNTILSRSCIYNNFFVIRLKWYYESKRVKSFVHELIEDDLILREYIGEGCVHSAMLEIDNQVKVEYVTNIPYGHNFHLMPLGYFKILFRFAKTFEKEMNKFCQQLTVLRGARGVLKRIKIS